MCSVPSQCWRISGTARAVSLRRSNATSRLCCAFELAQHLVRVRDSLDQIAHLALDLGHRDHEPGRVAGLRKPDVETHVGAPVDLEARALGEGHVLGEPVQAVEIILLGALRRQHGGAGLHHHPVVQHGARLVAQRWIDGSAAERRLLVHEGAARAPAQRDEVPALHERGDGLSQGRARDAQLLRQLAFRWQPRARREQAEADGCAEPLHRFLEGGGRLHRLEDRVERRAAPGRGRLRHHGRP